MSVRKRTWRNRDGSKGKAWIANYTDRDGKRRLKTFDDKESAAGFERAMTHEPRIQQAARQYISIISPEVLAEIVRQYRNEAERR